MVELPLKHLRCNCGFILEYYWRFCPNCSKKTFREDGMKYVLVSEFKALVKPLMDLNSDRGSGVIWLASIVGVHDSRIRTIFNKQKYLEEATVERWLIKLGLHNALYDGTIKLVNREIPKPPISKFFEE